MTPKELKEQYKKETGLDATFVRDDVEFYSVLYTGWLQSRLAEAYREIRENHSYSEIDTDYEVCIHCGASYYGKPLPHKSTCIVLKANKP